MKNSGKILEGLVKQSATEQGWDITRFRDAGYRGGQTDRNFTIRNICDYVMFKAGHLFYMECKAVKSGSLAFKRLTQHKDLMKKHSEGIKNVHAGYLLSIEGMFYYVPVFEMDRLMINLTAASVNKHHLADFKMGTVLPPRKKKERIDLNDLPIHENYE